VSAAPLPEDGTGWYLYGVVAASGEPPRAAAVDPRGEVVSIAEGRLAAVASQVSLAEFDESALSERLADTEWLEQKIRAHEQVLETVLASSAVVPCRFCTVYRDEGELRRFLSEHGDTLADTLARFEGRVEIGVKAFVQPPSDSRAAQASSGRAYLEARREEQRLREELGAFQAALASELHEVLLAAADDGVALTLQSRDVSGRDQEMLFNGAYLVGDRANFEQALAGVARERAGVELELTGPWPPYNFVPDELGQA
jgi:Gas vesicle synthesis protein GvpL/GvpF